MNRFNNIQGTIKCMNGGEYLPRHHFSGNAIQKYSTNLRRGTATRDRSGISCLSHTSAPRDEIKCEGPCNLWKHRSGFSKSTLKNQKYWCKECTDWQVRTEVGQSLPPPGSEFTADDRNDSPESTETPMAYDADIDDDDNTETTSVISTAATIESSITPTSRPYPVSRVPRGNQFGYVICDDLMYVPPYMRPEGWHPDGTRDIDTGYFVFSKELGRYVPVTDETTATTTATTAATPSLSAGTSSSTATTNPSPATRRGMVPSTAYGPPGQRIAMGRASSEVSSRSSAATKTRTSPTKAVKCNKSGWAKAPSRKLVPHLPEYLEAGYVQKGHKDFDDDLESPDEP